MPTSTENMTLTQRICQPRNHIHAQQESQSAITLNVATSYSMEKEDGGTQTTIEEDGLVTVTLVEIIVEGLISHCIHQWDHQCS